MSKTDKKAKLLESALGELALQPGASMGQIAEKSGVGRATLHRYFPKREDLLKEVALEAIRLMDKTVARVALDVPKPRERFRQTLEALIPLGDRFHFLNTETSVYNDPEVRKAYDKQIHWLETLVQDMGTSGDIAPDVNTAWVIYVIDSLIYAAWSAVNDGYVARDDAGAYVFRTVLEGLGGKRTDGDNR